MLLKDLVPPLLWRAAASLRGVSANRPGSPRLDGRDVPLEIPATGPKALNYVTGDPVFVVPMGRVRYPDGRRYTPDQHHFVQYYETGLCGLRRFYERHQPTNVFEAHFLKTPAGMTPPEFGVPWFSRRDAPDYAGEAGLGPEHGDQAHGPVSEQKLLLEAARLDGVLASIRQHGFRPDYGGYPEGYFMLRRDGDWVFTVRVGFHRVAAMAYLGFEAIEAVFSRGLPRFVEECDVAQWPMVSNQVVVADDALAVFEQYFREIPPVAASSDTPQMRVGLDLTNRLGGHLGSSKV